MKISALLNEVIQSFFKKPATELYPVLQKEAPERYRGQLIWEPDKCTGCQLCVKDCPADALELIVLDKATKRFVMKYYENRCIFCAQCVHSCRPQCLTLSNQAWEMASLDKTPFTIQYGRDEDLEMLLEKTTQANTELENIG